MKLHFLNDPTYIGGRSIHLMFSSTSHYSLPMTTQYLKVEDANIILHINDVSKTAKEKKPQKLQRMFAHVSKKKLVK